MDSARECASGFYQPARSVSSNISGSANVHYFRSNLTAIQSVLLASLITSGLFGCNALMLHRPTNEFDGTVVRGVVTARYSTQEMERNWELSVKNTRGAPSRADYVANYHRVVVRVGRSLTGVKNARPFIPDELTIDIGDIVEFYVSRSDPTRADDFQDRVVVRRIVCKYSDPDCLSSPEGRKRGIVG